MGVGYEDGKRVSIGCSRKGKLWSLSSGSLADWRTWCDQVGAKLSSTQARPDDFLRYTLVPVVVHQLPASHALMVDWPDQMFESASFRFEVICEGRTYDFHSCELGLSAWDAGGATFTFALKIGDELEVGMRLRLLPDERADLGYLVEQVGGPATEIDAFGRRTPVVEFFNRNPPLVRLNDGSQLAGNILLQPQEALGDTFDRDAISTLPWADTDLRQESRWRGGEFRPRSIQQRFIEHLERGDSSFIVDDDDNGESGDVVEIEETGDKIVVTLWHCKYASGDEAGHRASDLYVVCGQAQKSVKWTWSLTTLTNHLISRETKHRRGRPTRFIRGSLERLVALRKASRRKYVTFRVGIVQPGLRKTLMPVEHLAILGATSSFLRTVTNHPLLVVTSD